MEIRDATDATSQLTGRTRRAYGFTVSIEVEPLQQTIRKVVGRPRDPKRILTRLHHLQVFARNLTQDRELIREGDYFPVRKVVGRPDRLRR